MNYVAKAVQILGGQSATARIVKVSPKAVRKWVQAGKLPRTEATGETRYAHLMSAANPKVDRSKLLATVMVRGIST